MWPTVSELLDETFHAPLGSFVWRCHIGVLFWCTNTAAGNQQKHLEFTFSIKALSFHWETSICAHKHILEMVILLKIKRRDFFHRDSIPILVSCTVKTQKFKLLYFRNETCYRTGNAFKRVVKLKKSFISSQHFSLVVFCYCTVLHRMQHPLMDFLGFI